MIFSNILKYQIDAFLKKFAGYQRIPVFIIDNQNAIITGNELAQTDKFIIDTIEENWHIIPLDADGAYSMAVPLKNNFSSEQLATLELAADVISTFITYDNELQNLSQETLERYVELNLLYDITSELSAIFDEKELCTVVLTKAMQTLNVCLGAIYLRNPGEIEPELVFNYSHENALVVRDESLLAELARKSSTEHRDILYDDYNVEQDACITPDQLVYKSSLTVPINSGKEFIGAVVLVGKLNGSIFNSGDVKLLQALTSYAGVSINSARMFVKIRKTEALQHEMKLARNIQQSLLPFESPLIKNLEIAGKCLPAAEVGGDFFSYSQFHEPHWDIAVADVSGHGVGAALTMASLRSILRSESRWGISSKKITQNVNLFMCEDTLETGMYATLLSLIYNEDTKILMYCNAGHQVPFWYKAKTKEIYPLKYGGLPVGMFAEEIYEEEQIQLENDDIVVIYTDGMTEAKNSEGEYFGEDQLIDIITNYCSKSAAELLDIIFDTVKKFQGPVYQKDDITVVILKVNKRDEYV